MTEPDAHPPGGLEFITRREDWVELVAPNRLGALDRIDRLLSGFCDAEIPAAEREELRFALSEICRNAWEWGNQKDDRRKIRVGCCRFQDQIVIKIEDEGAGFDPGAVPDPSRDIRNFLSERADAGKRAGGFGLHMVRKIMDQVVFNEKGNVVVLSKIIQRRTPS